MILISFVTFENPFKSSGVKMGKIKLAAVENIWEAKAKPKIKDPLLTNPNLYSEKNLKPSVKNHNKIFDKDKNATK